MPCEHGKWVCDIPDCPTDGNGRDGPVSPADGEVWIEDDTEQEPSVNDLDFSFEIDGVKFAQEDRRLCAEIHSCTIYLSRDEVWSAEIWRFDSSSLTRGIDDPIDDSPPTPGGDFVGTSDRDQTARAAIAIAKIVGGLR